MKMRLWIIKCPINGLFNWIVFVNHRICRRYDEIADRLGETPTTTAEIVALGEFLRESSEVTVFKLKNEIDEAANRLMFLLDYANLPCKYLSVYCFQGIWSDFFFLFFFQIFFKI